METRPSRVVVEHVAPSIDGGRFPVKRTVGESVLVTADVHADGHDLVAAVLRWRPGSSAWREVLMEPMGNDAWRAEFPVERLEPHEYAVEGWIDPFATWSRDLDRRVAAGQEGLDVELAVGAALVAAAAGRASGEDRDRLSAWAAALSGTVGRTVGERVKTALDPELAARACLHPDRSFAARSDVYRVDADVPRARFSAWYEFFPRSTWDGTARHATLAECGPRLEEIAKLGFDVVYLPPIHPIGRSCRKGPNNAAGGGEGAVGSPWAIGSPEGGHTAVHPELGTVEDVARLAARARELGLDLALDLAFQCSPDHPWVSEHPGWFRRRPDGTVRHAENPPKVYEDIVPLDFECEDWRGLWEALRDVALFWAGLGVRVFRVDNPHTKPHAFWEWMIAEVRRAHPEAFFLSEAFTRPKTMARLAKSGFAQSYTYFTWRRTADELISYVRELAETELSEYFRPSFWPNTPDILPETLQSGGRAAFLARLVAAATLSPSYGVYGPAYELCEAEPTAPGREEYLDSEKYELKAWDLSRAGDVRAVYARLNRIRRENAALQRLAPVRFHDTGSPDLLVFSKRTPDLSNVVVVAVNLDPHHLQSGWVALDGPGLDGARPIQAHDLLGGARYLWTGAKAFIELDPSTMPAQIFRVRRRLRTERDFDYYL